MTPFNENGQAGIMAANRQPGVSNSSGDSGSSAGTAAVVMSDANLPASLDDVCRQLRECLEDLQEQASLEERSVFVVGASTSEILGKRIGSSTSLEAGRAVVAEILAFADNLGVHVVFQCCEHLNRSLVVKRSLARLRGWQEVAAIPVPGAGGAVAASAYLAYGKEACLVESVSADAGIDIGDTFIGMHLKRVAVPVRGRHKEIGQAHVTMARTRPPLVGGVRGVYDDTVFRERMGLSAADVGDAGQGGAVAPDASRAGTASPTGNIRDTGSAHRTTGTTGSAGTASASDSSDCL